MNFNTADVHFVAQAHPPFCFPLRVKSRMPITPRTASSSSTSIAVTTSNHHWLRQQHLRWSIPPHLRLTPIVMQSIHISTLRKILSSPEPIDIRLCTRSGEIQSWHRCISLKYDFYKGTRRMKLLDSNEIRQLRDVCIFEVNGIEVYMWFQTILW